MTVIVKEIARSSCLTARFMNPQCHSLERCEAIYIPALDWYYAIYTGRLRNSEQTVMGSRACRVMEWNMTMNYELPRRANVSGASITRHFGTMNIALTGQDVGAAFDARLLHSCRDLRKLKASKA